MKTLKPITVRSSKKQERAFRVLLGLVEVYLHTGRPVGSNTLKENGFAELSSATIRNYFACLEADDYLAQQHSSGGRIPTAKAFRAYAHEFKEERKLSQEQHSQLQVLRQQDTREIAFYLQGAANTLSSLLGLPVFFSAPRFDQDFVLDIKLVRVDALRCLVVMVTDFGLIQTEVLPLESKTSSFGLHRIEAYFHWRLTGCGKPDNLKPGEELLAKQLYNEIMVRYLVTYSNCSHEHLYQTGFSRLLAYPEFNEASNLASGLALFENTNSLRLLLRETTTNASLRYWIGDDLQNFTGMASSCSAVALPYRINNKEVGALGVLGPMRMPYREVFASLHHASDMISEMLTRSIYKHKITYRQPSADNLFLAPDQKEPLKSPGPKLLEDRRN